MKNYDGKTIFEKGRPGRRAFFPEDLNKREIRQIEVNIPNKYLRKSDMFLPSMSERELAEHFINLSQLNMSVDTNFYPLGSCTMKYNPKINEKISSQEFFRNLHPYMDKRDLKGLMYILNDFESMLCSMFGFDAFTFQPAAGAHGELTALIIAKKYFKDKGESERDTVIVPDSSHGTNPASAFMCGFERVVSVKSNEKGEIDLIDLEQKCNSRTACVMITNPNTLGIFETKIKEIAGIVHKNGALLYCDGANMNALMGIARPGDMGFDFMHLNLHKTFSSPHGGGGPGSGPVGVKKFLKKYITEFLETQKENAVSVKAFWGNLSVIIKAYCYVKMLGFGELKNSSVLAVLNARYLMEKLRNVFVLPYKSPCMHEFVLSVNPSELNGVRTLDIAKALIDRGVHPPTVYFPLIVKEAIMIEPTETETKETLDNFASIMAELKNMAKEQPQKLKDAPCKTPVKRLDEVYAARKPVLCWKDFLNSDKQGFSV